MLHSEPRPDHDISELPDGRNAVVEAYEGQRERRLSLRLVNYWRHLRGDRSFVMAGDIVPAAIAEMWTHCFILDVRDNAEAPRFAYVGAEIAGISGVPETIEDYADVPENSLLARAFPHLAQVYLKRCPVIFGSEFRDWRDLDILYRMALLPLGGSETALDAVLGLGNCRTKENPARLSLPG